MADDFAAVRVLNRSEALKLLGVSDRTWDRLEAVGDTPIKTRISQNRIGYRLVDIAKWLDARRERAPAA
jgi:predicted DNA-binding transcriptional regulator AlpA